MSDNADEVKSNELEILFPAEDISSEDDMSEWSSLEPEIIEENVKKRLFSEGQYSAGSGEVCAKYIAQSDSWVFKHPYYNYPAIIDNGITKALLAPVQPTIYPDDGQKLYLKICEENDLCPVRMFHRNLLDSVINLNYYGVDPKAVFAMAKALKYNKYVTRFDLTGNFLSDDSSYHLGQMLKTNTTLRELILEGCRIGASGVIRLCDSLNINNSLVLLNIGSNAIGDIGGEIFTRMLSEGSSVKQVNLSYNNLGRETAISIVNSFSFKVPKLTHINLSWNNFTHVPSTAKMLEVLSFINSLQVLNLSYTSLQGERIGTVIGKMLRIPSLLELDLSNNRLQGEAIPPIIDSFAIAKKLITFDISSNPLSPEDAYSVLEKMTRRAVKLQNLVMDNVDVNKSFLGLLERVNKLKYRANFVATHGNVLRNWTIKGPNAKEVILQRADYLCNSDKKSKCDLALYFLGLSKVLTKPIITLPVLMDQLSVDNVPLTDSVIEELGQVFAGPKSAKHRTVNVDVICEYISRLWPDKKLPNPEPIVEEPPPPPEPEPEPKKKKKGKK